MPKSINTVPIMKNINVGVKLPEAGIPSSVDSCEVLAATVGVGVGVGEAAVGIGVGVAVKVGGFVGVAEALASKAGKSLLPAAKTVNRRLTILPSARLTVIVCSPGARFDGGVQFQVPSDPIVISSSIAS